MDIFGIAHLGRFKDIVAILIKYGFDDVADRLRFPGKRFSKRVEAIPQGKKSWARFRRTLEELGPTFVKLGQILSLRADILPVDLINEMEKLQDDVPADPFAEISSQVSKALNQPLEKVFSSFDEQPLAAASLAHVHRAVLRNSGKTVAVKVRRPGIQKIIEQDLHILEILAPYLNEHLEISETFDLVKLVEELRRAIIRELDFSREAQNMRIVAGNFVDDETVFIPGIYEEYCSESMITMDLAEGLKLKDLEPESFERKRELARKGMKITLQQILADGFFHADPHPGNFLILENDVICLLDWGIVGILSTELRYNLADFIEAIVQKDAERTMDLLLDIVEERPAKISERALQRDIQELIIAYHSVPIGKIQFEQLLTEINSLFRRHHMKLPGDMTLMFKALITAEGAARNIFPELDIIAETRPYIEHLSRERYNPFTVWKRLKRQLLQLSPFHGNLPRKIIQIIEKIEKGELNIRFHHENLDKLHRSIEASSHRLSFSIITSALIIGSSMIITTGVKPFLFGYPMIGIIGYLISAILGLGLIWDIIRHRKM
ncbi:MAG: AarF/UbiB family protein [Desulfurivibrionaceae bacterium]